MPENRERLRARAHAENGWQERRRGTLAGGGQSQHGEPLLLALRDCNPLGNWETVLQARGLADEPMIDAMPFELAAGFRIKGMIDAVIAAALLIR